MEARLAAVEDRLRQTEEVLVQERGQTAEAAQQGVGAQAPIGERASGVQSLVDTKAIGKPPTFSGDVDPNGQPEGMPWSQWSSFSAATSGVRPGRDRTAAASGDKGGGSNGCRQHNHDRGGKATFGTAVLRARLDLQREVAASRKKSA